MGCTRQLDCTANVTAVGFEPTPLRTGALSQRLRPLGQTVTAEARANSENSLGTPRRAAPCTAVGHANTGDSCGVRTHVLARGRLKPAPQTTRPNCLEASATPVEAAAAKRNSGRTSPTRGSEGMTAVGFEPTQLALVELESTPLDHSGKLS